MVWYKKVYKGAAFEHRIQASVGLSIVIAAVVLPMTIYRIRQLKNRDAPIMPDTDGQKIANLLASKLSTKQAANLNLNALSKKIDTTKEHSMPQHHNTST
jgi:hypothetical protein|tara:strand:+ start:122 stop:421 length:300 start_codon:yes stop_codon:yes gene_type:complete